VHSVEKLRETAQKYAEYTKHCRKQNKRLAAKCSAELLNQNEEIRAVKADFEKIADENSAPGVAFQRVKQQLIESQSQLKQTERKQQNDAASLETEKQELRDRFANEKRDLESRISTLESERSSREEELEKARREGSQWKRRNDLLVNERHAREAEVSQLKRELEDSARDFNRKVADERAASKSQTDKTIDSLKNKNRELSELTQ
jgi:chromosome segregation ATPase